MFEFTVTFLGTASAMPVKDRNQSAQALNVHGRFFLVDCGDGTQRRLVQCGVPRQKINAIFISHVHGDHVYGLNALLSTFGMDGRTAPLYIYGPPNLGPMINFFLSYSGDAIAYEIKFVPLKMKSPELVMETKSAEVLAFPLDHGIDTFGFIFREKRPQWNVRKDAIGRFNLSLTEIGTLKRGEDVVREDGVFRHEDLAYIPYSPRSYAYVSDTAVFPGEELWLKDVRWIYHEATYLAEHADKAVLRKHSTTLQAASLAREAGAERLYIGHYSSRNLDPSAYEAECRTIFAETYAVRDGDIAEFPLDSNEA